VDLDVGAVRAAHRRAFGQVEGRPGLEPHRRDHLQAGLDPGAQVRALAVAARDRDRRRGGRLGDHAGLLVLAQVAHRAACHPEQEEVEHREEPELEGNCYWVLHRYSSSKPSDTRPSVISSPGESTASRTRLPLTLIPFVEPRSTTVQPSI